MLERLGVRWRLLLAFFGISAFAVIAAAAAMYSFAEVGKLLGAHHRGAGAAGARLARAVAPGGARRDRGAGVPGRDHARAASGGLAGDRRRGRAPRRAARRSQGSAHRSGALAAVEPAIDGLERNLAALDALVAGRLEVAERKEELLRKLSGTNIATQRLVAPGVLVMDSKLAEWRRASRRCRRWTRRRRRRRGRPRWRTRSPIFMPQQKAQIELSSINEALTKAAAAETPGRPAAARLSPAPLARHPRSAGRRVRRQAPAAPARAGRGVPRLHGRPGQHPRGARRTSSTSSPRPRACSPRTSRCRARSAMPSTAWSAPPISDIGAANEEALAAQRSARAC